MHRRSPELKSDRVPDGATACLGAIAVKMERWRTGRECWSLKRCVGRDRTYYPKAMRRPEEDASAAALQFSVLSAMPRYETDIRSMRKREWIGVERDASVRNRHSKHARKGVERDTSVRNRHSKHARIGVERDASVRNRHPKHARESRNDLANQE